jgi:hypothetical protein
MATAHPSDAKRPDNCAPAHPVSGVSRRSVMNMMLKSTTAVALLGYGAEPPDAVSADHPDAELADPAFTVGREPLATDPIFALIEQHQRANDEWAEAVAAADLPSMPREEPRVLLGYEREFKFEKTEIDGGIWIRHSPTSKTNLSTRLMKSRLGIGVRIRA